MSAVGPPDPPTSQPESVQRLKSLLRKSVRVSINDGRIFVGTFAGTDKQLNILLVNADEYRIGGERLYVNSEGRFVGQIMVPWRLIMSVEAQLVGGYTAREDDADSDDENMYS
ncbi:hypothetical protein CERSUDRAFT_128121 [Gelatoporia subvermispora B]|uniref:Sm domain-containing protein n=1 Tax=Ceriporiopsis subvermispora (strain B) TaxID=914234 RepID=M2PX24_CERS8|nr:hypothetical protein CERSUDRAFT_128121 [Gelatoporia subvermispora B]